MRGASASGSRGPDRAPTGRVWWRDGVFYQVYPRSFADSDGDGVGDIRGLIERLDHLSWLGVDGLWLNPITRSPNTDWGYDVADYLDVEPELGTLGDVDELVAEAGRRRIAIVLDLVPNHTSDRHPWFVDSRSSRTSSHRSWYVWADPKPDGSPPNNWLSVFGGPAWTLDEPTGQSYLHNFLSEQPDLNWWNEDVRAAFDEIVRFWFDRGVAGFRIDVAHGIVKDEALRDNLPVTEDDDARVRSLGQRQVYNMHRPEVHDVLRRWRAIANEYDPERVLIGETWAVDLPSLSTYYGSNDDELHLAFNFAFATAPLDVDGLRPVVERTEELLRGRGWPVWTASNHDIGRFAARWCGGDERKVRAALVLLLSLRGTPFLYFGDELGLGDGVLTREQIRDPVGIAHWPSNPGRDGGRTPMPWTREEGAGFTRPGVEPWLPIAQPATGSVEEQRERPGSILCLARDLIRLRRRRPDLARGDAETLASPPGTWVFRRGARTAVALRLAEDEASIDVPPGRVLASADGSRIDERVAGELRLRAWDALVLGLDG
jgi:alpha-glucosidase